MRNFRYIDNISTLQIDKETCISCGNCVTVCPHRIFMLTEHNAEISDRNACIECGACAKNCPAHAISVNPGVGCAAEIIARWVNELFGRKVVSGCC